MVILIFALSSQLYKIRGKKIQKLICSKIFPLPFVGIYRVHGKVICWQCHETKDVMFSHLFIFFKLRQYFLSSLKLTVLFLPLENLICFFQFFLWDSEEKLVDFEPVFYAYLLHRYFRNIRLKYSWGFYFSYHMHVVATLDKCIRRSNSSI